jgi:hypothetical protein
VPRSRPAAARRVGVAFGRIIDGSALSMIAIAVTLRTA